MQAANADAKGATWTVYQNVPTSLEPKEDDGYNNSIIQSPAGATLQYTTEHAKQSEKIILAQHEELSTYSVAGFCFGGSARIQGLMFSRLRD
jgi:multidrug efflux pump subunit AcrB